MKHIFSRLLIPAMVALLLLPPLSCLIFHQAARRYARDEAVRESQTLQERIVPIMEDSLSGGGEEDPIRTFVGQAGPLAAQMGGNARLMILAGEMQIIYPRGEQLRASVEPLAEEFRQYIQGNGPLRGDTDTLTAGDGEAYLVSVYEASVKSPRLRYVITYCPASRIGGWVTETSVLVLAPFEKGVTACGEEELLGKVLENLLTNAIRYARTAVTVSVRVQADRVAISVSDDGGGIDGQDLPHLFERCYKGRGGHFGIGLAIAHTAAEQMQGQLTAANRQEGGAVFTLTLPAA